MTQTHLPRPAQLPAASRSLHSIAPKAARQRWIERLSRFGLVTRGLIYFVPGVFAIEWALGRQRGPMTPASAIDVIGQQPAGRALLMLVAIGLAGYALWGGVRAVFDPLGRGHSAKGIAQRIGFAISGVAYLGLLLATVRLLLGKQAHVNPQQDWTLAVLARPFGGVIVLAIGMCWIFGSGIAQILAGWSRSFLRDLALDRFRQGERRWAISLGRIGLVSRGIVFTVIGGLIVATALHPQTHASAGLDGALVELAHQPFGRALLGLAGLGLMTFGTYSAMCARWMRMQRASGHPELLPSHLPSP